MADNDSKGCGGVMRVAPIGLASPAIEDRVIFETGTASAAFTHGHPAGHLSAGYFAVTIASLVRGEPLIRALELADAELQRHGGNVEVARAIDAARELASRGRPGPEELETLGAGWVAEEALSIAVCCALTATRFGDGVLLAVNHSGDSDSTGSIAGNMLGAAFGVDAIPQTWLDRLELRQEIERIAVDLDAFATGQECETYPPN
jgi:ADP-ribosylglycohydrolase